MLFPSRLAVQTATTEALRRDPEGAEVAPPSVTSWGVCYFDDSAAGASQAGTFVWFASRAELADGFGTALLRRDVNLPEKHRNEVRQLTADWEEGRLSTSELVDRVNHLLAGQVQAEWIGPFSDLLAASLEWDD